jgi:hypothetical protein
MVVRVRVKVRVSVPFPVLVDVLVRMRMRSVRIPPFRLAEKQPPDSAPKVLVGLAHGHHLLTVAPCRRSSIPR